MSYKNLADFVNLDNPFNVNDYHKLFLRKIQKNGKYVYQKQLDELYITNEKIDEILEIALDDTCT